MLGMSTAQEMQDTKPYQVFVGTEYIIDMIASVLKRPDIRILR